MEARLRRTVRQAGSEAGEQIGCARGAYVSRFVRPFRRMVAMAARWAQSREEAPARPSGAAKPGPGSQAKIMRSMPLKETVPLDLVPVRMNWKNPAS